MNSLPPSTESKQYEFVNLFQEITRYASKDYAGDVKSVDIQKASQPDDPAEQ